MKSLVIVTKSLAPYRVRFYQEIATDLQARGWRVAVIAAAIKGNDHPWANPKDMAQDLRIFDVGGTVHKSMFWQFLSKLSFLPPSLLLPNKRLIDLLENEDAHVVWTHEYSPFCLAASLWASLRDRISLVSTDIGDNPPAYACTKLGVLYHRLVSFLYNGVIAQSAEATRRSRPENAPVLFAPHAIDTDEYFPAEHPKDKVFRFLFTGSLDDRKGVTQAIHAGKILAEKGLKFELRILGTGPLADWIRNQSGSWISIGGFIEGSALRDEYRNANAYILPTRGDTYAVSVHEAAASGLALIVGKTAGAVETLVKEGISGFAIDPDDVTEIYQKMEYCIRNPERTTEMGIAARNLAEQYNVVLLSKKTAQFIVNLVTRY